MYTSCAGIAATVAWQGPVVAFDPYQFAIAASEVIRPDGRRMGRAGYAAKRKKWPGSASNVVIQSRIAGARHGAWESRNGGGNQESVQRGDFQ